jgi:antitoxin component of MazEF toxin-antitoxin module
MTTPQYEASVIQVGNSRGMRLPAGFFQAHPEFKGKVSLTPVGDGQVLMSAKVPATRATAAEVADPVFASFLSFLEKQLTNHPEHIAPANAAQLARIGKLVKGVKLDDGKDK